MGSRQPEGSGEDATSDDARRTGKMASSLLSFSRRAIVAGERGRGTARAHLEEVETPLQADHTLAGDRRGVKLEVRGEGSGRGQRAEAREGSSVVNSFYARTAVDRGSPRSGS